MEAVSARETLAREVALLGESQAEAIHRLLHDLNLVPPQAEKAISARDACRAVNKWLLLNVGDLLCAGDPLLHSGVRPVWKVPVQVHYGRPGLAATIDVDAFSGQVLADENTAAVVLKTVQEYLADGAPNPAP